MSWFLFYCRTIEIFVYCYVTMSFIPKVWKRIRVHAKENLRNLKKYNPKKIHEKRTKLNKTEGRKVTMINRQWEDNEVLCKQNVIDTNNPKVEIESNSNDDSKEDSYKPNRSKSLMLNNEWMERGININDDKKNIKESNITLRRRNTVIEIAKKFENNENNSKIHMASKTHHIPENYFECHKKITNDEYANQKQQKKFIEDSNRLQELVKEIAINKINNPKIGNYDENQQEDNKISYSSYGNVMKQQYDDNIIKNEKHFQEINESFQKDTHHQITNGNDDEDQDIKENSYCSPQYESEEHEMNAVTPTPNETSLSLPPPPSSSSFPSSMEVKLRRNHHVHDKVHSVEEILKQQRFSRRLSAYSISEFLKDFPNEVEIDEIINNIEK